MPAGIPGRFWACHSKGAWALSIQWLPHLAEFLLEANQQDAPDVEQLPAPALQELLVADSPITSMAAVGGSAVCTLHVHWPMVCEAVEYACVAMCRCV